MRLERFVSIVIFALGLVPILLAYFFKINLKKMLPDIIFGFMVNLFIVYKKYQYA